MTEDVRDKDVKGTGGEDEKFTFSKWYEENKESLAERRRKRYETDEEYRQKRILEARRFYWLKKRRAVSVKNRLDFDALGLKPDIVMDVKITNENDIRHGLVISVPMYYPRSLAKVLGRTVQTIRLWSLQNRIPEATYRSPQNYRLFTEDQMRVYARNQYLLKMPAKDFYEGPFFVKMWEDLAELDPDGIQVMAKDCWRFDVQVCPCFGNSSSLQHRFETGWETVPCFNCMDPLDIQAREKKIRYRVTGTCSCGERVEITDQSIGAIVPICPMCGKKLQEYDVKQID